VLYGLPTPAAREAAESGELRLAGCILWDETLETSWECRLCHHHFPAPEQSAWSDAINEIVTRHGEDESTP
jgi:hypothetical protein